MASPEVEDQAVAPRFRPTETQEINVRSQCVMPELLSLVTVTQEVVAEGSF